MKHYTLRLLSRLGLHLAVSFPFVSQLILLAFDPFAMQMTDLVQIHNIKLELVRMVILEFYFFLVIYVSQYHTRNLLSDVIFPPPYNICVRVQHPVYSVVRAAPIAIVKPFLLWDSCSLTFCIESINLTGLIYCFVFSTTCKDDDSALPHIKRKSSPQEVCTILD